MKVKKTFFFQVKQLYEYTLIRPLFRYFIKTKNCKTFRFLKPYLYTITLFVTRNKLIKKCLKSKK